MRTAQIRALLDSDPKEGIRATAALMRKRADKATTGDEPLRGDRWFYDLTYRSRNNYEVIAQDQGSMIAEVVHGRWAAEHIASWHPSVAHAVADWLDAAAKGHRYQTNVRTGRPIDESAAALVVATAYIGQEGDQ